MKPYEDFFWRRTGSTSCGRGAPIDTGSASELGQRARLGRARIATEAAEPVRMARPGLEGVQGLVTLQDLELLEKSVRGEEGRVGGG
jgi:hypothetical protein